MPCEICGVTTNLMSCGRCLKASYCSREHQIVHWSEHKRTCNSTANTDIAVQNGHTSNCGNTVVIAGNGVDQSRLIGGSSSDLQISQQIETNDQSNEMINSVDSQQQQQQQPQHHHNHHIHQQQQQQRVQQMIDSSGVNDTCNFSQESPADSMNMNYKVFSGNDFNAQVCPSMASVRVCDASMLKLDSAIDDGEVRQPPPHPHPHPPLPHPTAFSMSMIPSKFAPNRELFIKNLENYCQIILNDMNQYGFCVIDNFLQSGEAILSEVLFLYQRGLFRAGQVVNNKANSNSKLIRGDQIIWVDGSEPICINIGFLIQILDSIVQRCNTMFAVGEFLKYTITRRTKAMIACYPGNYTKYVRHIDNPNSDGRCITSIYYLNKDYDREKHGGVLRLFPQMNDGIVADIEPKFNRVIFFWSDRRNPHEVMPSARMRFAITVWYFDMNERAKAIQKYKENSIQYTNDSDLAPF